MSTMPAVVVVEIDPDESAPGDRHEHDSPDLNHQDAGASHLPPGGLTRVGRRKAGGVGDVADRVAKVSPPPGPQSRADLPHQGGGKRVVRYRISPLLLSKL